MTTQLKKKYRVGILGCGWYGLELGKILVDYGFDVKGSTTTLDKLSLLSSYNIAPYLITFEEEYAIQDPFFFDVDILVLTLPPKRASNEQSTFLSKIKRIIDIVINHPVQHLIFISSTSVYGENNEIIEESSDVFPVTDSGKSILAAENLLKECTRFTTTVIRFAGLVGPGRNPANFFTGKKSIPNGQAPINLIHISDCIGITMKIIEKEAFGNTFNACTPHHPQKQHFYSQASIQSNLSKPEFIDELKEWKIISSTKIQQLLDYTWQIDNWDHWLQRIK